MWRAQAGGAKAAERAKEGHCMSGESLCLVAHSCTRTAELLRKVDTCMPRTVVDGVHALPCVPSAHAKTHFRWPGECRSCVCANQPGRQRLRYTYCHFTGHRKAADKSLTCACCCCRLEGGHALCEGAPGGEGGACGGSPHERHSSCGPHGWHERQEMGKKVL